MVTFFENTTDFCKKGDMVSSLGDACQTSAIIADDVGEWSNIQKKNRTG